MTALILLPILHLFDSEIDKCCFSSSAFSASVSSGPDCFSIPQIQLTAILYQGRATTNKQPNMKHVHFIYCMCTLISIVCVHDIYCMFTQYLLYVYMISTVCVHNIYCMCTRYLMYVYMISTVCVHIQ